MPIFTFIIDPIFVLEVKFSSPKNENDLTATTVKLIPWYSFENILLGC